MRRLKLNRWLISAIALIMLFLVFRPQEIINPEKIDTRIPDSDYFMQGVIMHKYSASGKLVNTLMADRMEHSSLYDISILDKPKITFSSDKGQWQVAANNGEMLNDNMQINLLNNVTIQERERGGQPSTTITTKALSIDLEKNIASSEDDILIQNPHYKTTGKGLEFNLDKEIFYLKSNVTTEIYQ